VPNKTNTADRYVPADFFVMQQRRSEMKAEGLDYSRPEFKTMFANYGLTAVAALGLEKLIMLLIAAIDNIGKGDLPKEMLDEYLQQHSKRSLGVLIRELEKKIILSSDLKTDLQRALIDRNMIIHHFFVHEYETMLLDEGPSRLSNQLRSIRDSFVAVQSKIDDLLGLVSWDLNRTRSEMNPEIRKLLKEK
jgi:hypothetical protein